MPTRAVPALRRAGRSARRAARSAAPGDRSPAGDHRARSTTPPARGSRRRTVPSRTPGAAGRPARRDPRRTRPSRSDEQRARSGHRSARSRIDRQTTPSTASLGALLVRRAARQRDPLRQRGIGREASERCRELRRVARAAPAARRARRSAAHGRRACPRSRAAVRRRAPERPCWGSPDRPSRRCRRSRAHSRRAGRARAAPRTPPSPPARRSRARRSSASASWPSPTIRKGISGASRAAPRIVSSPWSGISFPTNSAMERLGRLPARTEEPILGADERDLDRRGVELERLAEEARVRDGVRHDDVGAAERDPVDLAHDHRGRRPCAEPAPIRDERVVERDERVEDDRSSPGHAPRRGHVEVPGIADDDDVGVTGTLPGEPRLGPGDASQLAGPRPTSCVVPRRRCAPRPPRPLRRAGTRSPGRSAGRSDRRCRSRARASAGRRAGVRAQRSTSSTSRSDRPAARAASIESRAISSEIRPSESSWIPTTTSRTPSVRSGRPPIASPVSLRTVR